MSPRQLGLRILGYLITLGSPPNVRDWPTRLMVSSPGERDGEGRKRGDRDRVNNKKVGEVGR